MQIEPNLKKSVIREIEAQLIQLDIKLKDAILVSEYVELLVKKREYQELLNQINNE
jgi:hypothetical protein